MRRTTWIAVMTMVALAAAGPGGADETSSPDPGTEAMAELAGMIGRWEGEGWMRRGPSEPVEFRSLELIEGRLDGRVLIVEGIHHDKASGALSHHALATISWDTASESYRFRSHLSDGRSGDYQGEMTEEGFVWGFAPNESAHVRYTIKIDGDRWEEVGQYSPDGESWQQFFAMSLRRAEAPSAGN